MKKRIVSLLVCFSLMMIMLSSGVFAAAYDISDGTYVLTLKKGAKALNVYAETVASGNYDGCNVTVWDVTGDKTQDLAIKSLGSSKYCFYAFGSNGRVLDVQRNDAKAGRPIEIGGNVQLWANDDPAAQEWILTYRDNGYWSIGLASMSNSAVGCVVPNTNGGNVALQTYTGSDSQLWQIIDESGNAVIPEELGEPQEPDRREEPQEPEEPKDYDNIPPDTEAEPEDSDAIFTDEVADQILRGIWNTFNPFSPSIPKTGMPNVDAVIAVGEMLWTTKDSFIDLGKTISYGITTMDDLTEEYSNITTSELENIRTYAYLAVELGKKDYNTQNKPPMELLNKTQTNVDSCFNHTLSMLQKYRSHWAAKLFLSSNDKKYVDSLIEKVEELKKNFTPIYEIYTLTRYGGAAPNKLKTVDLTFSWPIPSINSAGYITSNFAYRDYEGFAFHDGIDIGAVIGEKIIAAQSGTVLVAGDWDPSAGKTIIIKHDNGFSTRYSHLSEIYVKENQKVSRDQLIAKSGNTANVEPHLHFSVYQGSGYNSNTAIPPIAKYWAVGGYNSQGRIAYNRAASTDNAVFNLSNGVYVTNPKFVKYENPDFVEIAKRLK